MNIFMTDTQKYIDLKSFVESSYTSEREADDVWKSIRWNLLTPNQTNFIDEHLEMYSKFLDTGKPICHLDFFVDSQEDDPFLDALERSYVSTPCCEYTMGYVSESKRHYRFFFVNPDVDGAKDFSFMNKLALKDTYILVTYDKGEADCAQKYGPVPLHTKECKNIRFVVHCLVDSDNRHFRFNRMLEATESDVAEKDDESFVSFSAVPFENGEKDLQKRFNAKMNRLFSQNKEFQAQLPRLGLWKWSDIIQVYLF